MHVRPANTPSPGAEEPPASGDRSDGAGLAAALRARLHRDGYACDEVFADGDGWSFFASADRAPVCVSLHRDPDAGTTGWVASVDYEGGLSGIWSEQAARDGTLLATRIRARLGEYLASLDARAAGPAADQDPQPAFRADVRPA